MSEELAEFGRWLENEIDRREWKQADFAREGNFRPQNVSRWVRGVAQPSYQSARAIARTLRLPEDAVLVRTGHKAATPSTASPATGEEAILADVQARLAALPAPLVYTDRYLDNIARLIAGLPYLPPEAMNAGFKSLVARVVITGRTCKIVPHQELAPLVGDVVQA